MIKKHIVVTENSDIDAREAEKRDRFLKKQKKLEKKFNKKQEHFDNLDPEAMIFGNGDYITALIGYTDDGRAVYDYDLMVEFLKEYDEMTPEEAMEWIDYNTIRTIPYMGEKAPIIMYRIYDNEK
jgi:hypothetical protein